jgi:hypothetical protein
MVISGGPKGTGGWMSSLRGRCCGCRTESQNLAGTSENLNEKNSSKNDGERGLVRVEVERRIV